MLSDPQIDRYSRQIILPQVGGKGQQRLLQARVLVNGEGSWQAAALLYLAAAGVGHIGVWGPGRLPLLAALAPSHQDSGVAALQNLNPDCTFVVHDHQPLCDFANATQLVQQYDVVIAEPNAQIHSACYTARRPFVCGQACTITAWLAVYRGYEDGCPCFACEPLPTVETLPSPVVDWPIGSFLGTVLATEAIKYILGLASVSSTKLLQYTFPASSFQDRILAKNPNCIVCR